MDPLVQRATEFLEAEMDAGHMRRHEPRLLLLAIYSTVIGMVTEVEVLRAFGEEPTARSLVRRRNEILDLLRSALLTDDGVCRTLTRRLGRPGSRSPRTGACDWTSPVGAGGRAVQNRSSAALLLGLGSLSLPSGGLGGGRRRPFRRVALVRLRSPRRLAPGGRLRRTGGAP